MPKAIKPRFPYVGVRQSSADMTKGDHLIACLERWAVEMVAHVFMTVLWLVILTHLKGAGQLVLQRPVARAAPVVNDRLDFLQVRLSAA